MQQPCPETQVWLSQLTLAEGYLTAMQQHLAPTITSQEALTPEAYQCMLRLTQALNTLATSLPKQATSTVYHPNVATRLQALTQAQAKLLPRLQQLQQQVQRQQKQVLRQRHQHQAYQCL